ncbi:hypothetical protein [Pradoshia eiseniae]|uniref:hypothetical protein n=1 Tax=Pradoshia eiseniae TaxID=2064768 RepID=UPI00191BDA83|nr:hypothetical protein [Pradoshia eiseniae]
MPNGMPTQQQQYGNYPHGYGQQQGSFGYGSPQYFGGHGGYGGYGGYGGHGGGYPGMFPPMQHPQPYHQFPQHGSASPYSGGYGNFYGLPLGGWSGQYASQFGGPFSSPGYGYGTPLTSDARDESYSSF